MRNPTEKSTETHLPTATFDADAARWTPLVPETPLEPNARHAWHDLGASAATHVRLNIYPDGGVARLRLFGQAQVT